MFPSLNQTLITLDPNNPAAQRPQIPIHNGFVGSTIAAVYPASPENPDPGSVILKC
jgi:hypothetical protein